MIPPRTKLLLLTPICYGRQIQWSAYFRPMRTMSAQRFDLGAWYMIVSSDKDGSFSSCINHWTMALFSSQSEDQSIIQSFHSRGRLDGVLPSFWPHYTLLVEMMHLGLWTCCDEMGTAYDTLSSVIVRVSAHLPLVSRCTWWFLCTCK